MFAPTNTVTWLQQKKKKNRNTISTKLPAAFDFRHVSRSLHQFYSASVLQTNECTITTLGNGGKKNKKQQNGSSM